MSARRVWEKHGVKIGAPEILPGPDGSIDIHWNYPGYELLLNVPPDSDQPITYYGDDRKGNSLKGVLASADNGGFLLWLSRR